MTNAALLEALFTGITVGYDSKGARRVSVTASGISLTVVVKDAERIVVTVWEDG